MCFNVETVKTKETAAESLAEKTAEGTEAGAKGKTQRLISEWRSTVFKSERGRARNRCRRVDVTRVKLAVFFISLNKAVLSEIISERSPTNHYRVILTKIPNHGVALVDSNLVFPQSLVLYLVVQPHQSSCEFNYSKKTILVWNRLQEPRLHLHVEPVCDIEGLWGSGWNTMHVHVHYIPD